MITTWISAAARSFSTILCAAAFSAIMLPQEVLAQRGRGAVASAPGVEVKKVNIYSEGTRMSGDLYLPDGFSTSDKRPAIVMSHGWGGNKSQLVFNANDFAKAGFVALVFDYRGWGESDPLLVIKGDIPPADDKGEASVRVQLIRNVVDPLAFTTDIRKAFDYISGEPGVDPERLGYWGSSYSGGHAVWIAEHEPRAKAVVGQVPAADSVALMEVSWKTADPYILQTARKRAIERARGDVNPLPFRTDKAPNLTGWAYLEHVVTYQPAKEAGSIKTPMLLIDAENEELYSRHISGEMAANLAKQNGAPVSYVVVPGITHYGIYSGEPRDKASKLAVEWFTEYLKK